MSPDGVCVISVGPDGDELPVNIVTIATIVIQENFGEINIRVAFSTCTI